MKLIRIPYRPDKNRDKNFADVYLFPDFKAWMKELGLEYNVDYTANYMSGKKELHVLLSDGKESAFSYIQLALESEPWSNNE